MNNAANTKIEKWMSRAVAAAVLALVFAQNTATFAQGTPPANAVPPAGHPAAAVNPDEPQQMKTEVQPASQDTRQPQSESNPADIADSGDNDKFSYYPSARYEGMIEVQAADGSSAPALVSKDFMKMVMADPNLNNERRLEIAQSYLPRTASMRDMAYKEMYPAGSNAANLPAVKESAIESADGSAIVEQDPLAPGYARVTLLGKNGEVEEFTMNGKIAMELMAHPHLSAEDKMKALRGFAFKLPESVRGKLNEMDSMAIGKLAEESEAMQNQEFVKAYQIAQLEAERMATAGVPAAKIRTASAKPERKSKATAGSSVRRAKGAGSDPEGTEKAAARSRSESVKTNAAKPMGMIAIILVLVGLAFFTVQFFRMRQQTA